MSTQEPESFLHIPFQILSLRVVVFSPHKFIYTHQAGPWLGSSPYRVTGHFLRSGAWRHSCPIIHHFFSLWTLQLDIEKSGFDFFFFHFKSVEWPVHMDIKKYNQQVFVVLPQNPRHLKSVSYCFSIRLWIFFPQVVFLTGFGCVYVDTVHQGGTIFITVAPEGKAGPILTNTHR